MSEGGRSSAAGVGVGRLRRMILGAVIVGLVQSGIGIVVNLYVVIPWNHPGANPSDYFTGSFDSVVWAIVHGAAALAVHSLLGLVLVVLALLIPVTAFRMGLQTVGIWAILAAVLVIGAGFNGAGFLLRGENLNSLVMALSAFAALLCYAVGIYELPAADAS